MWGGTCVCELPRDWSRFVLKLHKISPHNRCYIQRRQITRYGVLTLEIIYYFIVLNEIITVSERSLLDGLCWLCVILACDGLWIMDYGLRPCPEPAHGPQYDDDRGTHIYMQVILK